MSQSNKRRLRLIAILIPALLTGVLFVSGNSRVDTCRRCEARHETYSLGFGLYEQESFLASPKSRDCQDHDWIH